MKHRKQFTISTVTQTTDGFCMEYLHKSTDTSWFKSNASWGNYEVVDAHIGKVHVFLFFVFFTQLH